MLTEHDLTLDDGEALHFSVHGDADHGARSRLGVVDHLNGDVLDNAGGDVDQWCGRG